MSKTLTNFIGLRQEDTPPTKGTTFTKQITKNGRYIDALSTWVEGEPVYYNFDSAFNKSTIATFYNPDRPIKVTPIVAGEDHYSDGPQVTVGRLEDIWEVEGDGNDAGLWGKLVITDYRVARQITNGELSGVSVGILSEYDNPRKDSNVVYKNVFQHLLVTNFPLIFDVEGDFDIDNDSTRDRMTANIVASAKAGNALLVNEKEYDIIQTKLDDMNLKKAIMSKDIKAQGEDTDNKDVVPDQPENKESDTDNVTDQPVNEPATDGDTPEDDEGTEGEAEIRPRIKTSSKDIEQASNTVYQMAVNTKYDQLLANAKITPAQKEAFLTMANSYQGDLNQRLAALDATTKVFGGLPAMFATTQKSNSEPHNIETQSKTLASFGKDVPGSDPERVKELAAKYPDSYESVLDQ